MINLTTNQVLFEKENQINEFKFFNFKSMEKKELLSEEFKSLGFFISNHPLNEYEDIFKELNIISYNQFLSEMTNIEGLVAGTIMSIQEKKVTKEHLTQ